MKSTGEVLGIAGTLEEALYKGLIAAGYKMKKNGGVFITGWTSWDLSKLGAVDKVVFSISGSPDLYGEYGFNAPAYFAIDDVAVRVYPD